MALRLHARHGGPADRRHLRAAAGDRPVHGRPHAEGRRQHPVASDLGRQEARGILTARRARRRVARGARRTGRLARIALSLAYESSWSPRVSRSEAAVQSASCGWFLVPRGTGLQFMQFKQSSFKQKMKTENMTTPHLRKSSGPVAFTACFPSDACVHLLWAFVGPESFRG